MLSVLCLVIGTESLRAEIHPVPAGKGVLPPAQGKEVIQADDVVKLFQKEEQGAVERLSSKPIRVKGHVRNFHDEHPLNHEHDFFVDLTQADAPWHVYVRFSHDQLDAFCLPEDKRPKSPEKHYADYQRTMNQINTDAYYDKDLNCIALHYSETLAPPKQKNKVPPKGVNQGNASKDVFESFSADKIPLLSVNDAFDADVEFEQVAAENTVIFRSTAVPFEPPLH
ncbi:hypothetical protein SAMN05444156_3003 [Verrucomicrobium sp. GAS474]|nr:hypothetical protein SAMN05444156_3003 [Verrucomicrobium sp. GAS474]